VHAHFLIWSRDGRFVYFAKGTPTTDMDIWRIPAQGGQAEQITFHHAWVGYPAWLDARTLIYSATADDGSGRWLYAIEVEHRIPHRVSSGIAEQYLSVAVDQVQPHHLVATVANPTAGLWTVPIANDVQPESAITPIQAANTRVEPAVCQRLSRVPVVKGRRRRALDARSQRYRRGALEGRRRRGCRASGDCEITPTSC
jgi:hypothetical protein